MMGFDIKPCSKCGSIYPYLRNSDFNGMFFIQCPQCINTGRKSFSREGAISAWNEEQKDKGKSIPIRKGLCYMAKHENLCRCYCGGRPTVKFDEVLNSYYVQCEDCLNTYPLNKVNKSESKVVEDWNHLYKR